MIEWQKCSAGITSKPRGGLLESIRSATGIFVVRSATSGDGWVLELNNGSYVDDDGAKRTFGFAWGFASKNRCMEYADALVVAYGFADQVYGTAEPSEDDLRVAKWWKKTRKQMGY